LVFFFFFFFNTSILRKLFITVNIGYRQNARFEFCTNLRINSLKPVIIKFSSPGSNVFHGVIQNFEFYIIYKCIQNENAINNFYSISLMKSSAFESVRSLRRSRNVSHVNRAGLQRLEQYYYLDFTLTLITLFRRFVFDFSTVIRRVHVSNRV